MSPAVLVGRALNAGPGTLAPAQGHARRQGARPAGGCTVKVWDLARPSPRSHCSERRTCGRTHWSSGRKSGAPAPPAPPAPAPPPPAPPAPAPPLPSSPAAATDWREGGPVELLPGGHATHVSEDNVNMKKYSIMKNMKKFNRFRQPGSLAAFVYVKYAEPHIYAIHVQVHQTRQHALVHQQHRRYLRADVQ